MKIEMGNLVRECDVLRKEVDFLGRSQGYRDLEKCSLEEKLRRSGRRYEELDKRIVEMGEEIEKLDVGGKLERSRVKCEELRREKFDANQTMEVLKRKEIEADQVVRELQCKNDGV
ncbi:hypothetical protein C2S51_033318 [Perilla frutescens var. frutescens]|nr:hypothetical protein C2S51_033318 [Perilla frutescens var. frutescens]